MRVKPHLSHHWHRFFVHAASLQDFFENAFQSGPPMPCFHGDYFTAGQQPVRPQCSAAGLIVRFLFLHFTKVGMKWFSYTTIVCSIICHNVSHLQPPSKCIECSFTPTFTRAHRQKSREATRNPPEKKRAKEKKKRKS